MDTTWYNILTGLFALYSGVMTWLFKTAWGDLQTLKKELAELSADCAKCQAATIESIRQLIDDRFDKIEDIVERKVQTGLDAGFTKMELRLINSGQLTPKQQKRSNS